MDAAEIRRDLVRLRRTLEDERAVRRAEVTALWSVVGELREEIQRCSTRPEVTGALVAVPGFQVTMSDPGGVPGDTVGEVLFERTVHSDEEEDILRQILQGEVSPMPSSPDNGRTAVTEGAGGTHAPSAAPERSGQMRSCLSRPVVRLLPNVALADRRPHRVEAVRACLSVTLWSEEVVLWPPIVAGLSPRRPCRGEH